MVKAKAPPAPAAAAPAAAAPEQPKRKRVSKAGTKNMRKNIPTTEFDDYIETIRHDERTGGAMAERDDAALFMIDRVATRSKAAANNNGKTAAAVKTSLRQTRSAKMSTGDDSEDGAESGEDEPEEEELQPKPRGSHVDGRSASKATKAKASATAAKPAAGTSKKTTAASKAAAAAAEAAVAMEVEEEEAEAEQPRALMIAVGGPPKRTPRQSHVDKVIAGNQFIKAVAGGRAAPTRKLREVKLKTARPSGNESDSDVGEDYSHPVTKSLAIAAKKDAFVPPPPVIGHQVAGFDLWSTPALSTSVTDNVQAPPVPWNKKGFTSDYVQATLPVPKRIPVTMRQAPSALPAVMAAHPGQSYNPDQDDHADALTIAAAAEVARLAEAERIKNRLKPYVSSGAKKNGKANYKWEDEVQDAFNINGTLVGGWSDDRVMDTPSLAAKDSQASKKNAAAQAKSGAVTQGLSTSVPMAVAPKQLAASKQTASAISAFVVQVVDDADTSAMDTNDAQSDEEDEEDEDEEDEEDDSAPYRSANPATTDDARKTKTQRNRERRERERVRAAADAKKARGVQQDIYRAKSIAQEVERELDEIEDRADEKAAVQEATEPYATKRLGRKAFVEEPMQVKLRHELPDTLRSLVQEGNLLKDRFLSLQRRNMVEARDRVAPKRRYKLKNYRTGSQKKFDHQFEAKLKVEAKKHASARS